MPLRQSLIRGGKQCSSTVGVPCSFNNSCQQVVINENWITIPEYGTGNPVGRKCAYFLNRL
jgi:hypothetical protein